MTVPSWLKCFFGALRETANVISLTILLAVCLFTSDWPLLKVGIEIEVVYLVLALVLTREWFLSYHVLPYRARLLLSRYKARLETPRRSRTLGENFILDQVLLIVTIAGAVLIMFFGFGKHLLTYRWYDLTHAAGWEAGAIGWTGLFLIYYLFKIPPTRSVTVDKLIFVALVGINLFLMLQAVKTIGDKPLKHIPYVLGIAACFLITDLMSSIFRDEDDIEKPRSRASLYWADFPMVFAFIVLFIYLWVHSDTEAPEVFVAGVIACQLLISNAVFIVMEFGLLQSPKTVSASESTEEA